MSALYLTTIGHVRTSPVRHRFAHHSCSMLVDPAGVDHRARLADLPWWARGLVSFRASDHLGSADRSWLDNIRSFTRSHGIDVSGGHVVALTSPRTLGHVFNPLTLYWCHDTEQELVCVIAEVHNTYGQRHAYLLRPDDRGRATVAKEFYVSPFNEVSGSYRMCVPEPTDELDVTVTLHRPDERPFVATWRGHRARSTPDVVRAALRLLPSTWLVSARIRWHGLHLWRRLPLVDRPDHSPQEGV